MFKCAHPVQAAQVLDFVFVCAGLVVDDGVLFVHAAWLQTQTDTQEASKSGWQGNDMTWHERRGAATIHRLVDWKSEHKIFLCNSAWCQKIIPNGCNSVWVHACPLEALWLECLAKWRGLGLPRLQPGVILHRAMQETHILSQNMCSIWIISLVTLLISNHFWRTEMQESNSFGEGPEASGMED